MEIDFFHRLAECRWRFCFFFTFFKLPALLHTPAACAILTATEKLISFSFPSILTQRNLFSKLTHCWCRLFRLLFEKLICTSVCVCLLELPNHSPSS